MKKYIFISISLAFSIIFSAYNAYQSQTKVTMSDIMVENIEALASGEEGTSVARCYLIQNQTITGQLKFDYFCNRDTDDDTIYPCPTHADFEYCDENKKDRCTK